MPTLTESDLNVSQLEIDQLKAALANNGIANAFPNTIAEQLAKVDDYTLGWEIEDTRFLRLARSLVLHRLWSLTGPVPPNHQTNYDEAMRELAEIRDGKFPGLKRVDPPPSSLAETAAKWGSTANRFSR
ncbi:MAG TPA: hypothetical protein VHH73_07075 [Verrucomicrobiae bacterium]|nr:hypothetical protein [Verrucomicrobiae bacterium]